MKEKLRVHIRWMIRRDMSEVLDIENKCFEFPWTEDDFIRCLRQRNCIGMVAEHDDRVMGYMIYALFDKSIHLLNFAVCKAFHRRGVGRQLVDKMVGKLSHLRRNKICLEIRDSNIDAQKFFSKCGFLAKQIMPQFYQETDDDAYTFEYQYGRGEPAFVPTNRIAGMFAKG